MAEDNDRLRSDSGDPLRSGAWDPLHRKSCLGDSDAFPAMLELSSLYKATYLPQAPFRTCMALISVCWLYRGPGAPFAWIPFSVVNPAAERLREVDELRRIPSIPDGMSRSNALRRSRGLRWWRRIAGVSTCEDPGPRSLPLTWPRAVSLRRKPQEPKARERRESAPGAGGFKERKTEDTKLDN
ncbi:hypothetical protein CISG_04357 [Coccidioides immitis RMSCC 3703]|uniref:Uncharacterized protein n=1 Tax=Coccidioides immitis RMSCC 3703 TaxID=454286 RepID=A0A0J8QSS0_COCIT|nr:hypothetical protein CISG_04357 [Coccidioides immitis RMSCC 3703]